MTATDPGRRVTAVLAGLVVLAAAVLVWLVTGGGQPSRPEVTSAESAEAAVASAAVKEQVREAAADAAARAYAYSWDTIADDKAAARALMTDDMQRRYDRTMAGVTTSSREHHTVVRTVVVDTALVTATEEHARVLVFANQRSSGDDLAEPRLDLDRVLVTLENVDGDWLVSELDAL
ncbi:hypothetical protein [Nocardioides sp. SYSU D00065]|uniref:hypothetical protein n=1 Tax=Nocardioides sp. SYSU D00065 TaxID=2817378 RepID=UPI001B314493|nr:hypothetical protein [Nocardioides sp. SYSU D00065]